MEQSIMHYEIPAVNGIRTQTEARPELSDQQRQWAKEQGLSDEQYADQLATAMRESLLKAQAESADRIMGPLKRQH